MSAVAVKLLEKCTAQGISLRPGEGFRLKVSPPPERLPEDLREELQRHKAEILALLRQSQTWTCPHCGRPVTIEDVCPSLDGERTLTMWRCERCQVVAATPDTIKQPPVWITRTTQ